MVSSQSNIIAIIPVYNEEFILPFCLQHLRRNGIHNYIILDNESTDNSASIGKDFGAQVNRYFTNGKFCEETITNTIKLQIENLDKKFEWIIKIDADEFIYSPNPILSIREFINFSAGKGFNCIGCFSHQTYPMREEIEKITREGFSVDILNRVIPHTKNDKIPPHRHSYSECVWKINIFKRYLVYENPHLVSGDLRLSDELVLLKHVPYTIPDISRKRLITDRKQRLSKRNFEIGLSTHYQDIDDNDDFVFDDLYHLTFDWADLYKNYTKNYFETLNQVIATING